MKGIKCSQCGLVYWSTDENCRRCGLLTADNSPPSYDEQQDQYQYQQQNFAPPPVVNYGDDDYVTSQVTLRSKTSAK